MSKVSRGNKGETLVKKELKKIKEHHRVLNDVTLVNKKSDMTHQIDHILIHPHGVFVIETKNYYGEIIVNNNQWYKFIKGNKNKITNPLLQNKSHEITLYRSLKGKYKIIPVVVFAKNNAPYLPDDNVINLKDLLLFIDSYPYEKLLSEEEMDDIAKLIKENMIKVTRSDHIQNIKFLKQIRLEEEAEISYAIESGKCPWCQNKMLNDDNEYKCSKCNFTFRL